MKILTASLFILPLMLIGAWPAVAGQPTRTDPPIQLAADTDAAPPADKESYDQKAKDQMSSWQQKVHDFNAQTAAKGKEVGDAASDDVNKAWANTQDASQRLQTAGNDGWQDAKSSFEKATQGLADAWHKVHPDDK
jgi:hypothetical protein